VDYFPIFLNLKGRSCLVVGGGAHAIDKTRLLLAAGARVTVVAPRHAAEIEAWAVAERIAVIGRGFVAGDVRGRTLVIAATGRDDVDARVAEAAEAAGVPINVVDRVELSGFIMPAIVDREPVVVAISTGGAAPLLAQRLRQTIERALPDRIGHLARFAGSFRTAVKAKVPTFAARRQFWETFFDGPAARAVLAGDEPAASDRMLRLINGRENGDILNFPLPRRKTTRTGRQGEN